MKSYSQTLDEILGLAAESIKSNPGEGPNVTEFVAGLEPQQVRRLLTLAAYRLAHHELDRVAERRTYPEPPIDPASLNECDACQ